MNIPTSGNLLDNAAPPPGATVSVTRFTVQGTSDVYTPALGPVTLFYPGTGTNTGTLSVSSNGAWTFTPAPGYVGPAPVVTYTVASSDGQTNPSTLTLDVLPRKLPLQPKCMHRRTV